MDQPLQYKAQGNQSSLMLPIGFNRKKKMIVQFIFFQLKHTDTRASEQLEIPLKSVASAERPIKAFTETTV